MGATRTFLRRSLVRAAAFLFASIPLAVLAGHSTGHTLWTSKCSGCHGATPAGNQLNAGNDTSTVLSYVITNQATMAATASVTALSTADRTSISQYIKTVLPSNTTSVAMSSVSNTIDVSNNLNIGGVAFSSTVICSSPASGSLAAFGADALSTYTPVAGFVGQVTFTYRGGGSVAGDCRTATINVGSVPAITSSSSKVGTVGVSMSNYVISATNNPSSYGRSGTFPTGLTVAQSGATISFTGTPTVAGTFTPNVTATNFWGTDSNVLTFTINKGSQTISFTQPTTPITYAVGSTFPLVGSTTASLTVAFTSGTPTVCSVSGTTATVQSAGTCTINANQAGNTNYNAATQVSRTVTINQAGQTISFTQPTTPVSYSTGLSIPLTASSTSGLAIALASTTPSVCNVSGSNATIFTAGTCTLTANQAGNTNYTAATQVVRSLVINATPPGAPTIGTATAGDAQVSVSFTAPANNGGTPITSYRATCSPSGANVSGPSSPLVVTGLANGVMVTCSVIATNAAGSSSASGTASATPSPAPVAPTITSANNTTFTVLSSGTFTVVATGVPSPTFSVFAGTLPTGVTLNSVSGILSGTPATGTAGVRVLTLRASNASGNNDQSFTLTVAKASQSISFTDPPNQTFGGGAVPLSATASPSGLTVAFTSGSPGVCSVTGTNATMLAAGDCIVNANQAGNTDYAAAIQASQTFTIAKGNQAITFNTQTTPSRAFSGTTFSVSPTATASSTLTPSYASVSPAVCSVTGATVTMLGVGTCVIQASQAGDSNWNAATPVTQNVVINQGSQSITFASTQGAQPYTPGGTFALNPLGVASSGLALSYVTLSPEVCTVSGTTVTIVGVGVCSVSATQEGNANYAAATPVTRTIVVNAVAPDAPSITSAAPSASGEATITFDPPANNGGSVISSYTVTCTGSGQPTRTATGPSSPLVVAALTDGVQYTCTVAATNSIGTGASSSGLQVTPSAAGPSIWATVCSACHGSTPAGARFNAAAPSGSTVLDHVISTQPLMVANTSVTGLTAQQRLDVVAYINGFLPSVQVTAASGVGKTFTVPDITIPPDIVSFTEIEIVTPPVSGAVTGINGTTMTYTSGIGFNGMDSFTYRGVNPGIGLVGSTRTATITVDASMPVLTVSRTGTGTGTVITESPDIGINCGVDCDEGYTAGALVVMTATPAPGSAFIGFGGACSGTDFCIVSMDGSKNVTAQFDLLPPTLYNLTVSKAGTGTGTITSSPVGISCGATCAFNFTDGEVVSLTAAPSANTLFDGWSGSCSGANPCVVSMTAARSATATFTAYSPAAATDLSVTQIATPGSVGLAKDVITTITASNAGPATATSVVVTFSLPPDSTFVWASSGCAVTVFPTVTCNVASLASGANVQFKVVGRPTATGLLLSNVSVSGAQVDPSNSNNTLANMWTVNPNPVAASVLRYRLYSPVTLEHHFTTDLNEYNVLGGNGNWIQEGTVGKVLNNPGSFNGTAAVPYYRLYDNGTQWHHWTTDANEYYTLIQFPGWNAEGVDGYILPTQASGTVPLYRLLYPFVGGLHHWTIDPAEYNALITSFGWIGEGGSGFVIP